MNDKQSAGIVQLKYESIRNLTSSDEKKHGTQTYFANIPAREILKLHTEANLRDYIPRHPGRQRTAAHRAIYDTLENRPDRFIILHGGFTLCALGITVDDKEKLVTLTNGSIINGAQSQGEVQRYFDLCQEDDVEPAEFLVRTEFIVETDESFVTDTAIARNNNLKVKDLSKAGKKHLFDEMQKSFQRVYPDLKLRMSESQTEDEFIDTEKLLQIITVLMPPELIGSSPSAHSKLKAYKNKAQCLVDYANAYHDRKEDPDAAMRYKFFVEIAPFAWREYHHWRHHRDFEGKRLFEGKKCIKRDKKSRQITVADGIIFPILGAMSLFVNKGGSDKWTLLKPSLFEDQELIEAAIEQLRSVDSNPMLMGRTIGIYESLLLLPKTLLRVMERVGSAAAE